MLSRRLHLHNVFCLSIYLLKNGLRVTAGWEIGYGFQCQRVYDIEHAFRSIKEHKTLCLAHIYQLRLHNLPYPSMITSWTASISQCRNLGCSVTSPKWDCLETMCFRNREDKIRDVVPGYILFILVGILSSEGQSYAIKWSTYLFPFRGMNEYRYSLIPSLLAGQIVIAMSGSAMCV